MSHKKTKPMVTLEAGTLQTAMTRRTVITGLGLLCLVFSPLLQGCKRFGSETGDVRGEKRGISMELNIDTPMPKGVIPPIDAAAPTRTETATFALG
jgi:hypothetical protein